MSSYDVIQNVLNKKVVCKKPPCSFNPPIPINKCIPKKRRLGAALRGNSKKISGCYNFGCSNASDNASTSTHCGFVLFP